jgi:hypothetical protein
MKKKTVEQMVKEIRHEVIRGHVEDNKLPDLQELKVFCKAERKRLKKLKHAGVPQHLWNDNAF